jgi:single-strand DNA-binding protein
MAADVNHVILIGRLTRDAELKYTAGGMAVCKFSLAVNRSRKSGDQWIEEGNFFDVVLWGRSGEAINQYLVKGKQVAVDGELRQDRWEQDGQKRSKVEIMANNVQLLGGGGGSGSGGGNSGGGSYVPRERGSGAANGSGAASAGAARDIPDGGDDDGFADDIPF